ncbi:MAG TPA: hypothetical protein VMS31_07775, partial [Pyrinomonadaceae bacterium]|nr:hypothetical protein [Pyrinomonadaceae bacterium]
MTLRICDRLREVGATVTMPTMIRLRWVWFVALPTLLVVAWLWWVKPSQVDMAGYAPASALLYLEANRPLSVADTIVGTDAWKIVETASGTLTNLHQHPFLEGFIRWTGMGPIKSVILARAQVAVVITELGTIADGDTLKVKPEGVVLIETHTSERRIRPAVEEVLGRLAELT